MDADTIAQTLAQLPQNTIYADWAASALPLPEAPLTPPTFIAPAHQPHHPALDAARRTLSTFFSDHRNNYHIIFTSGATAAFHLLADRLPWSSRAAFHVHAHVHNAVLGIRNPAVAAGASFHSFRSHQLDAQLSASCQSSNRAHSQQHADKPSFALLAYPAECNLTGTKYPLRWAQLAKRNGLLAHSPDEMITILDTAKSAASAPVNLAELADHVDAVVFSLYKLSASYTGLGALLVRKSSLLERLLLSTASTSYFAGGRSVDAVSPFSMSLFAPARSLPSLLELGTPNMQAIAHLPAQLARFSPPNCVMAGIYRYAVSIAHSFRRLLFDAFPGGRVKIHTDQSLKYESAPSSVVSFTLYRIQDLTNIVSPIGHGEVHTILTINNVYARAGCMCNTGACAAVLGLSDDDVAENYAMGHRCGDEKDLVNGKPTGVVRVSFGWASLPTDANAIVRVLRTYVSVTVLRPLSLGQSPNHQAGTVRRFRVDALYLYPVKSCGGSSVKKLLSDRCGGVLGDRAFAVKDAATGDLLSVRTCPQLTHISARYSHDRSTLVLRRTCGANGPDLNPECHVELREIVRTRVFPPAFVTGMACDSPNSDCMQCNKGPSCSSTDLEMGATFADEWLSEVTGREVSLVLLPRQNKAESRDTLVVYKNDFLHLQAESNISSLETLRACIRPNVILANLSSDIASSNMSKAVPAEEDIIRSLHYFYTENATIERKRACTRCTVVNSIARSLNVKQQGEPLRSIARLSRRHGVKGLIFGFISTLVTATGLQVYDEFKGSPVNIQHTRSHNVANGIESENRIKQHSYYSEPDGQLYKVEQELDRPCNSLCMVMMIP